MTGSIAGRQPNPTRDRYDFYPTEARWTEVLMREVKFKGTITEPCAGDGAMATVIQKHGYQVLASDICPRSEGIAELDALKLVSADNVVTNAPFRGGFELIQHWRNVTSGLVCVLTQMSFLESKVRSAYFQQNPPREIILVVNRMDVLGKKSQFPHTWIVWERGVNVPTTFKWRVA